MRSTRLRSVLSAAFIAALGVGLAAQQMQPTPPRGNQGEGPFDRLVIRGVTMIDGTGAQPRFGIACRGFGRLSRHPRPPG